MLSGDECYGDDITSGPGAQDEEEILTLIAEMPEDERREVYAMAEDDEDNDWTPALCNAWACFVSRKGRTRG